MAQEIVAYREKGKGAFPDRQALKKVPFLGDARFQQAAGFCAFRREQIQLDETGVHPEAYGLVKKDDQGFGLNECAGFNAK